jgi:putative membrane protein (TIGR04086 family)
VANTNVVVRPANTAWGAVLGGWVATIGASVIFAPLVAGLLVAPGAPVGDIAVAVPVVLGLFLSYVVGGYVAGRMAGYRTSWHGMMTAFFTLFILLVLMLLGVAADNGMFAASGIRSAADIVPGVRDLNLYAFGDALTFGAILGFLAAIFGGWLGGLLAPSQVVAAIAPVRPIPLGAPAMVARTTERREVVTERPRRILPILGSKGGERVETDEMRTPRVENSVQDRS